MGNNYSFLNRRFEINEDSFQGISAIQKVPFPSAEQARQWVAGMDGSQLDRVFYVIGFSDGAFLRELLGVINETNEIFVIEPDLENFRYVIENYDLSDLLSDRRIKIFVENINDNMLFDTISCCVNYDNYKRVMCTPLPGYENYIATIDRVKQLLVYQINKVKFDMHTNIALALRACHNEMRNMPSLVRSHSINQLTEALSHYDLHNIPAIIVSAGPSLDKNIQELHKAKNHAFIIVVDTALKAVLRAGIIPDIMICVDPRKETILFEHEDIKTLPAVFGNDITAEVVANHEGAMFFDGKGDHSLCDYFYTKYHNGTYISLLTGGSVANSAFSLAVELGFETIIFVGQDLAFTGGRGHTSAAYDDEKKNQEDTKRGVICEVMGIDGEMLLTDNKMKMYLEWFGNAIESHPHIHAIDATEGGALIRGTEIMPLRDAIKRECRANIDTKAMISNIKPLFNDDEQQEIADWIMNIDDALEDFVNTINYGIQAYEDLRRAVVAGNQARIRAAFDIVSEINNLDKTHPLMQLIKKYCMVEEYAAKDALRVDDGTDINVTIDNAILVLRAYIAGAKAMKEESYILKDGFKHLS